VIVVFACFCRILLMAAEVRFNPQLNEEFRLIDCQESWV
jgi:hypothetical protein